jgi:ABC-type nickel/cobalt efflux system permease component RcnA
MKFAFLPHYFKKIGVTCFFSMLVFIMAVSIITVCRSLDSLPDDGSFLVSFRTGMELGEELMTANHWIKQVSSILLLLSMAFYMLAKEKVDDEYMDAMRWESLRMALIISTGITILSVPAEIDLKAKSILLVLFIGYLVIFQIKKKQFDKEEHEIES